MDTLLAQRPFVEYGYGWLACGITILLWIAKTWMDRRRPRHIVCREVEKVSLVRLQRQAGDRISVQFDRKRVSHLAQLEMLIENRGSEDINAPSLVFSFGADTVVLDATTDSVPENAEFRVEQSNPNPNELKLSFPYLNPARRYRHKIRLRCICDGDISDVRVHGGGADWSPVLRPMATPETLRKSVKKYLISVSVLVLLTCFTFGYALRLNNRVSTEIAALNRQILTSLIDMLLEVSEGGDLGSTLKSLSYNMHTLSIITDYSHTTIDNSSDFDRHVKEVCEALLREPAVVSERTKTTVGIIRSWQQRRATWENYLVILKWTPFVPAAISALTAIVGLIRLVSMKVYRYERIGRRARRRGARQEAQQAEPDEG